ncbi:MAG: hypothetical protein RJA36_2862 [Pseudomonadota bacterium]
MYRPRYRVETKHLNPQEQKLLQQIFDRSDFFNLPDRFSLTGYPDTFEYRMTVNQDGKEHTVIFHDDDGHPESLDELMDWLRDRSP